MGGLPSADPLERIECQLDEIFVAVRVPAWFVAFHDKSFRRELLMASARIAAVHGSHFAPEQAAATVSFGMGSRRAARAVLHGYDAIDRSEELPNSNQAGARDQFGPGDKFHLPSAAAGKVFVGTPSAAAVIGLRWRSATGRGDAR